MQVEIGKRYVYFGKRVKVVEIHGEGPHAECVIEDGFMELKTVPIAELEEFY